MSLEDSGQEAPNIEAADGQEVQEVVAEDPVKNIKSEFSRKFENLQQEFRTQNEQMQSILQVLQEKQQAGTSTQAEDKLADLIYDNPEKALEVMERRISSKVEQQLDQRTQAAQKTAQVVSQVQALYPEFKNESSEAYQAALKIHQNLPSHLRGTAEGAEMAMLKAVTNMGLIPASKRQKADESDDFTMQGSRGSSEARKQSKKEPKVEQATIDFAKLLNPGKSEEDIIKGLKQTVSRDSYKDWR